MPVKVTKDGQMVERLGGDAKVGSIGKVVRVGYTTIESAGTILSDEQVDKAWLDAIQAGDGPPGVTYYATDEAAREEPVALTPEAAAPQDEQGLNPGRDASGDAGSESYQDQDERRTNLETDLQEARDEIDGLRRALEAANARVAELEPQRTGQDASVGAPPAAGGSEEVDFSGGDQYQDDPEFDPNQHVQAEVLDYLKTASPDEVARVKELEASKQDRQQIASYEAPEG